MTTNSMPAVDTEWFDRTLLEWFWWSEEDAVSYLRWKCGDDVAEIIGREAVPEFPFSEKTRKIPVNIS